MRRTPAATYLWPGLPRLWVDGSWAGLAEAIAFALLVDGLLLASWVWTEWLGPAGCASGGSAPRRCGLVRRRCLVGRDALRWGNTRPLRPKTCFAGLRGNTYKATGSKRSRFWRSCSAASRWISKPGFC